MPRLNQRRLSGLVQMLGWPLLGLLSLARLRTARLSTLLEIVDTWLPHLLVGWPLLGLLAARWRSPSLGLLAVLGSLFGLSVVRSNLGRSQQADPSRASRLRVLTANVLATNPSPRGLAEVIAREQPDLVACQEVRGEFGRQLIAELAWLLPHAALMAHHRFAGALLLSRWPIEQLEHFRLSERGHHCQHVRIQIDGRPLEFFNVHLETPFEIHPRESGLLPFGIRSRSESARDREIDTLIELMPDANRPALVVGDFNVAAGSRPHRQLTRHFCDAFQQVGRGFGHTFPQAISIHGMLSPVPLLRIDYAFYRGALQALSARTLHQPGSDHRALLAEFALGVAPDLPGRAAERPVEALSG